MVYYMVYCPSCYRSHQVSKWWPLSSGPCHRPWSRTPRPTIKIPAHYKGFILPICCRFHYTRSGRHVVAHFPSTGKHMADKASLGIMAVYRGSVVFDELRVCHNVSSADCWLKTQSSGRDLCRQFATMYWCSQSVGSQRAAQGPGLSEDKKWYRPVPWIPRSFLRLFCDPNFRLVSTVANPQL